MIYKIAFALIALIAILIGFPYLITYMFNHFEPWIAIGTAIVGTILIIAFIATQIKKFIKKYSIINKLY